MKKIISLLLAASLTIASAAFTTVQTKAEEAPAPAEEATELSEEAPAPAEEVAEPAEETAELSDEVAAPAEEVAEPTEETAEPAEEPAEEPAAEPAEEPAEEPTEEPAERQMAMAHLKQSGKSVDVAIDLTGGWSVEFARDAFYLQDGGYSEDKEAIARGIALDQKVFEEYCAEAAASETFQEVGDALFYTDELDENVYLLRVGDDANLALWVQPGYDSDEVFARVQAERGYDIDESIDYMALVNKLNALPENWEDLLDTVHITNSVGDDVEVESKAYIAYLKLAYDLAQNDGIYLELDSARRSVEAQQEIMDSFIEKYGADYAAKTVAQPGYSEHHTGLALDLYFKIKNEDGSFTDVYYNEDMEKEEYRGIWDAIHAKLADYGFILRYLEGEEHITGYRYEPWHIRYLDDVEVAREIMSQPGMTLEEYLAGEEAPEVSIDLTGSELYTEEELYDAMLAVKCKFAAWDGCELHSIRYAGDEANTEENVAWLNSHEEGTEYTQALELLMNFHTAADSQGAWDPDREYEDYQWWLARTEGGDWEIVDWGYGAGPGSAEAEMQGWTREGYFTNENGDLLSVTWVDYMDEPGWYAGIMMGDIMTGWTVEEEEGSLRGNLNAWDETAEPFNVTIAEEGEDGLLLTLESGETYHFTRMEMPEATIFVTVNVEGGGMISYAEGEETPEFDPDWPYQSAQINLAEPTEYTLAAAPEAGCLFVKWTKDGEDFSTEPMFTVLLDESADYVAVFEEDPNWQNPVMNFIGNYQCDRAHALVECLGRDEALITIDWAGSAWDLARWTIVGRLDMETLTVSYFGCSKQILTYGDNGELKSEETEYGDGTGTIVFNYDDNSFTWHEDEADRDDMVFEWAPVVEE